MRALGSTVIALLAWGCAEADEPGGAPEPDANGYRLADPVQDAIADDAAEGEWTATSVRGRPALTRSAGGAAFFLYCDTRDGLVVEIRNTLSVPPRDMLRLSTAGASQEYAVLVDQSTGAVRAKIPAVDTMIARLLEAEPVVIAFGTEAQVEFAGSPRVAALVRTCRRSEST